MAAANLFEPQDVFGHCCAVMRADKIWLYRVPSWAPCRLLLSHTHNCTASLKYHAATTRPPTFNIPLLAASSVHGYCIQFDALVTCLLYRDG